VGGAARHWAHALSYAVCNDTQASRNRQTSGCASMYVWVQVNHSNCTFYLDYDRGQILSTVTWANVQNVKLLLQFLSVVLEHVTLGLLSYCLLTPLMSPIDRKCKLIENVDMMQVGNLLFDMHSRLSKPSYAMKLVRL